jgi:hypothetical protein
MNEIERVSVQNDDGSSELLIAFSSTHRSAAIHSLTIFNPTDFKPDVRGCNNQPGDPLLPLRKVSQFEPSHTKSKKCWQI